MKTSRTVMALALCALVCSCSVIPQASAYSSAIETVCEIPVKIIQTVIDIDDGEDVDYYSTITPDPVNDTHTYNTVSTTDNGHPAIVISSQPNPDANSDIVSKNETFDLDIMVPKGIYFVLKIENSAYLAQNEIHISCGQLGGNQPITFNRNNNGTHYIGTSDGNMTYAGSMSDSLWIYSDTQDITIHLEGKRGNFANWNVGGLQVTLIMKETA